MHMFTADAHCDTLYALAVTNTENRGPCVTADALKEGGVGLQTFALFAGVKEDPGTPRSRALAMLEKAGSLGVPLLRGDLPDDPPQTPHGVLSIEGAEVLEGSLEALTEFARQGVKMIALTWNYENEVGYPAASGSRRGLKPFGRELLGRMGELGILADVSHLNDQGIDEVLSLSRLPVVASHSNLRKITDVPRNLSDAQARGIADSGGFIGVNFYTAFLTKEEEATLDDVLRHIDGLCELGAQNAVGFGSDFDGISRWPRGLATPADFPHLLDALGAHGYDRQTLEGIAGMHLWRTYRRAQKRGC